MEETIKQSTAATERAEAQAAYVCFDVLLIRNMRFSTCRRATAELKRQRAANAHHSSGLSTVKKVGAYAETGTKVVEFGKVIFGM